MDGDWEEVLVIVVAAVNDLLDLTLDLSFPVEFLGDLVTLVVVYFLLRRELRRAGLNIGFACFLPLIVAELIPPSDLLPLTVAVALILWVVHANIKAVAASDYFLSLQLLEREDKEGALKALRRSIEALKASIADEVANWVKISEIMSCGEIREKIKKYGSYYEEALRGPRRVVKGLVLGSMFAVLLDPLLDYFVVGLGESFVRVVLLVASKFAPQLEPLALIFKGIVKLYKFNTYAYDVLFCATSLPMLAGLLYGGSSRKVFLTTLIVLSVLNPIATPSSPLSYVVTALWAAETLEAR